MARKRKLTDVDIENMLDELNKDEAFRTMMDNILFGERLGAEFEAVLNDNLDELYEAENGS